MKIRAEDGAGLLDYKFLVAIVLLVAIGGLKLVGAKVQRPFCEVIPGLTEEYHFAQYNQIPSGKWVCIGISASAGMKNVFTDETCNYYDC